MVSSEQRVLRALQTIIQNKDKKALQWAVNYTHYAIEQLSSGAPREDVRTQLLYVLNNITHWRGTDATVVRGTLKEAVEAWK